MDLASVNTGTDAYRAQTKRYIYLLFALQAIGASSPPIIISLGGLVGETLSSNKTLSTLPVSLFNIGLALSVLPIGFMIARIGRVNAYTLGALSALIGGAIAAWGVTSGSFGLFCLGCLLAGCYAACVQSYRFAITDYVARPEQPMAISRIMLGGLLAAVIGPQLVIWTQHLLPVPLSASFLSQSLLALIALLFLWRMRQMTAQLAAQQRHLSKQLPQHETVLVPPRSLREIASSFRFISIAVAGLVSYGLMTFMMTATPLAMLHSGHSLSTATLGIQWHILAMYAPGFVTGRLMTRFGPRKICVTGLLLTACAAAVSMVGNEVIWFWSGLILLGVGWNFGFVSATVMLTSCYTHQERLKTQSLNDTFVFGTTALASLLSGQMLHIIGWFWLNILVFIPVMIALGLLFIQYLSEKKQLAGVPKSLPDDGEQAGKRQVSG
ncbi:MULTISPECIES: MFS transporter [unclassified Serratia (in: enterobacteria)]|uniref:MFS transporter n=1 Tax=unclassified Serratia (in: enterobacteria) TaxID=2647522 RepID=UPI000AB93D13|nr:MULTISPECIES: MFS transporter [unclassified Serratia (in: enterobacteria)]